MIAAVDAPPFTILAWAPCTSDEEEDSLCSHKSKCSVILHVLGDRSQVELMGGRMNLQVLSDADADRVQAAVEGIRVFVDTLVLVTDTQAALASPGGDSSQHGATAAARAANEQVCVLATLCFILRRSSIWHPHHLGDTSKRVTQVVSMLIAAGLMQAEDNAKPMAVDGTAEQPEPGGPPGNNTQNAQEGAANGTADAAEQAAAAPPSEAPKPGGRPSRATVSCQLPPSYTAPCRG